MLANYPWFLYELIFYVIDDWGRNTIFFCDFVDCVTFDLRAVHFLELDFGAVGITANGAHIETMFARLILVICSPKLIAGILHKRTRR